MLRHYSLSVFYSIKVEILESDKVGTLDKQPKRHVRIVMQTVHKKVFAL